MGSIPSAASTEFYSWQDLRLGSALQVWHCDKQHSSLVGRRLRDIICLPYSAQSAVPQRVTEVQLCSAVCLNAFEGLLTPHMYGMFWESAALLL